MPTVQDMHAYSTSIARNRHYPHAPLPGTHSMDVSGSLAMGDDAADTDNNKPNDSASGLGNQAQPFINSHAHANLDPPPHHSAAFPFNSWQHSLYAQHAQQTQDNPQGASAVCPVALQRLMNAQGSSQPGGPQLATRAPDGSQNMFMHAVPHMQGSYPGHFSAHIPQQNTAGMQMVPAHLIQTVMPFVNAHNAMSPHGMPLAAGAAAPMHAGMQVPVATAHTAGTPLHGSFPQLDAMDHTANGDRGGGHRDLQPQRRPSITSEMSPSAHHSPGTAAAAPAMLAAQGPAGGRMGSAVGSLPGEFRFLQVSLCHVSLKIGVVCV